MANPPPNVNAAGTVIPVEVRCMFALDQAEVRAPLAVYLAREPAQRNVVVPGDVRLCAVVSDTATNTAAALVYWIRRLHMFGFSIGGVAPGLDSFCVNVNGLLKGTQQLYHVILQLTPALRLLDMSGLGTFAEMNVFQIQAFPGPVIPDVQDLLHLLAHFGPNQNQYLRLISHPALENAVGKSAEFKMLYDLLMALRARDPQRFRTLMTNMSVAIISPDWVHSARQNAFLHWMMRYSFRGRPTALLITVRDFLSSPINCSANVQGCLQVRRNGESHLLANYHGVHEKLPGTQWLDTAGAGVAMSAAVAAINARIAFLTMQGPNQPTLGQIMGPLFTPMQAKILADAIMAEVQHYRQSALEAGTAATAAATYLGSRPAINTYPLQPTPPPYGISPGQWHQTQTLDYTQQTNGTTNAANNAIAALQQAQANQAAAGIPLPVPQPLTSRNLFDVRDVSNMFTLMEPNLLHTLHRTMFAQGELQDLAWYWESKEVHLRQ